MKNILKRNDPAELIVNLDKYFKTNLYIFQTFFMKIIITGGRQSNSSLSYFNKEWSNGVRGVIFEYISLFEFESFFSA